MEKPIGVHVRLPNGVEEVYEDLPGKEWWQHKYSVRADGSLVVHAEGFLDGERQAPERIAVYAPGGWHRVRSRTRVSYVEGELERLTTRI